MGSHRETLAPWSFCKTIYANLLHDRCEPRCHSFVTWWHHFWYLFFAKGKIPRDFVSWASVSRRSSSPILIISRRTIRNNKSYLHTRPKVSISNIATSAMEKGKITLHANAVNLARRYTEMNENDLMMVSECLAALSITSCLADHCS